MPKKSPAKIDVNQLQVRIIIKVIRPVAAGVRIVTNRKLGPYSLVSEQSACGMAVADCLRGLADHCSRMDS